MTDVQLKIWFAGFYEGEGSISNDINNRNRFRINISQNDKTTVIQLREPVGGARIALQKALGNSAQVGHSQIRVPVHGYWKQEIVRILEGLANFKAEVLELASAG